MNKRQNASDADENLDAAERAALENSRSYQLREVINTIKELPVVRESAEQRGNGNGRRGRSSNRSRRSRRDDSDGEAFDWNSDAMKIVIGLLGLSFFLSFIKNLCRPKP